MLDDMQCYTVISVTCKFLYVSGVGFVFVYILVLLITVSVG